MFGHIMRCDMAHKTVSRRRRYPVTSPSLSPYFYPQNGHILNPPWAIMGQKWPKYILGHVMRCDMAHKTVSWFGPRPITSPPWQPCFYPQNSHILGTPLRHIGTSRWAKWVCTTYHTCDQCLGSLGASYMHKRGRNNQKSDQKGQKMRGNGHIMAIFEP